MSDKKVYLDAMNELGIDFIAFDDSEAPRYRSKMEIFPGDVVRNGSSLRITAADKTVDLKSIIMHLNSVGICCYLDDNNIPVLHFNSVQKEGSIYIVEWFQSSMGKPYAKCEADELQSFPKNGNTWATGGCLNVADYSEDNEIVAKRGKAFRKKLNTRETVGEYTGCDSDGAWWGVVPPGKTCNDDIVTTRGENFTEEVKSLRDDVNTIIKILERNGLCEEEVKRVAREYKDRIVTTGDGKKVFLGERKDWGDVF